jgi:hypothetical protein
VKEEENDILGIILPYLKSLHYSRFNVPTFVEKIPLVVSEISGRTMSNFGRCLKDAPWNVTPISIEIN